jgi:cytoskeletal protein CcmA (bactofilin family)
MFDKEGVFGRTRSLGNTPQNRNSGSAPGRPADVATKPAEAPAAEKEASSSEDKGSKLIVGPNIKLKGAEILDCDTLVVEGRVEASMNSRVIQIFESGTFIGKAEIDVAEIHGRFEGDITARKRLVVHASGRVSGKIRYGKVSIEDGGEIIGDISSLSNRSDNAKILKPAEETPRPAAVPLSS